MTIKFRSILVLLIVANYLIFAAVGGINRPERDSFLLLLQEKAEACQRYESHLYLRTNALDAFIAEALAANYKNAPDSPYFLYLMIGIDVHVLQESAFISFPDFMFKESSTLLDLQCPAIRTISLAVFAPPKQA